MKRMLLYNTKYYVYAVDSLPLQKVSVFEAAPIRSHATQKYWCEQQFGFIWVHLGSFGFIWFHSVSFGFIWFQADAPASL